MEDFRISGPFNTMKSLLGWIGENPELLDNTSIQDIIIDLFELVRKNPGEEVQLTQMIDLDHILKDNGVDKKHRILSMQKSFQDSTSVNRVEYIVEVLRTLALDDNTFSNIYVALNPMISEAKCGFPAYYRSSMAQLMRIEIDRKIPLEYRIAKRIFDSLS